MVIGTVVDKGNDRYTVRLADGQSFGVEAAELPPQLRKDGSEVAIFFSSSGVEDTHEDRARDLLNYLLQIT